MQLNEEVIDFSGDQHMPILGCMRIMGRENAACIIFPTNSSSKNETACPHIKDCRVHKNGHRLTVYVGEVSGDGAALFL